MVHGYIVIRKRNGTDGPRFPVKQSVKIGRGTNCDVRIHVQSVSEQHCLVLVEKGERAIIQNLSSTSQTIVNGVSIGKNNLELAHGDVVTVGERSFTWHYAPTNPFHKGKKTLLKKRRKSEADSTSGIQNVAVVKPLDHKRRTMGPSVTFPDWSSSSRALIVESVTDLKYKVNSKSPFDKTSKSNTPNASSYQGTPITKSARSSVGTPKMKKTPLKLTPAEQTSTSATPAKKTPAKRFSLAKTPVKRTSVVGTPTKLTPKKSSAKRTSVAKTPGKRTSTSKTPAKQTHGAKSPALSNTPAKKTTAKRLSLARTPGASPGEKISVKCTSLVRTPAKQSPVSGTPKKSPANRISLSKTPGKRTSTSQTPAKQTPVAKAPAVKSPSSSASPAKKTPAKRLSVDESPAKQTPAGASPYERTSVKRISLVKTPAKRTPVSATPKKSPANRISLAKTPGKQSPSKQTPVAKSPAVKSPAPKIFATKSPAGNSLVAKTPSTKSPPVKSPLVKTPLGKSELTISRKSVKTPKTATPGSSKNSKSFQSTLGSLKRSGAQKRRLSSSPPVVLKRMKMDSTKSADKTKFLKSPRSVPASTLSTVKVILSSRKTTVIKAIKTPRSSTTKKQNSNHFTPGQKVKSSVKKSRRPLFSEILKKKAVQTANAVAKRLVLAPRAPPKAASKKVVESTLSTEIPIKFHFSSTGHANSPEPIFIGRKVVDTPVVTKKGRKNPILPTRHTLKDNVDLSGLPEIFKTPGKVRSSPLSPSKSGLSQSMRRSQKLLSPETASRPTTPLQSSGQSRLSSGKKRKSSLGKKDTPFKQSGTPPKVSPCCIPSGSKDFGSSFSRNSSVSAQSDKAMSPLYTRSSSMKTPASKSRNQSNFRSSTNRQLSLLTSTPAAFGQRLSSAGLAFESPSSLLSGHRSAPQSPASGRKSRLDMVPHKTSYVHSPNASPVKSSLKSSPSRSPEFGEHTKNLSVSFSDNIHIQMLVPGSKKGLNTTASLCCPASPFSEEYSNAGTPDATTFDFNSIKTPNVPCEMYVSSILSSGTSSSGQSSGSAKRKGKALNSPQGDVSNLHGVRRLMKTPTSPAGYVDVKGVKRLMAASCKTPTYLAVEGVKKLFGDAAAASGNELASFVGVRELFASPSSPKTKLSGRFSWKGTSEATPKKSSPVAKIQAEVEGKKTPTFSPASKSRASSSTPGSGVLSHCVSERRLSSSTSTPQRGPSKTALVSEESMSNTPVSNERKTRSTRTRAGGKNVKSSPESSRKSWEKTTQKRGRKPTKVSSPKREESGSPAAESPKKRPARKAAKASSPSNQSVEKEIPNVRSRRGAKASSPPLSIASKTSKRATQAVKGVSETSPVSEYSGKGSSKQAQSASPPCAVDQVSPVKLTRRGKTRKAEVSKPPSPSSVPQKKRTRRQNTVTTAAAKSPSPKKSSPITRRTRKGVAKSEPTSNLSPAVKEVSSTRKRKVVTFDDQVATPKKKGKTAASEVEGRSSNDQVSPIKISPVKRTKAKRAGRTSKKSSSPIVSVSPRRTRSRR